MDLSELGIPVTPPLMTMDDVGKCVNESMSSVELFLNPLGQKYFPKVKVMYDKSFSANQRRIQLAFITKVRLHVQLTLVGGQARWRLVEVPPTVDKYHAGDVRRPTSRVILP